MPYAVSPAIHWKGLYTGMSYIVLDLEWNQAMSSQDPVFNRLPIRLRGEIIQIGAVKLNEDFTPGEEFHIDVRPIYFKRMHYRVKKITGFDKERLLKGVGFPEAFREFRQWCGDNATFITWGYDDQGVMEQNIIIHDLDWDWIDKWVNLQLVYNVQTGGDRTQKALSTAMEHFRIEQTRTAHDALGDAYNTALICSHLNMAEGLEKYEDCERLLAKRVPKHDTEDTEGRDPVEHRSYTGFDSRADAFTALDVRSVACPDCGKEAETSRWVNQGDRRYMTRAQCPDCGKFLVRLKFRRCEDETWSVNRIIYRADDDILKFYKTKASAPKRRSRRKRKKAKPQ